MNVDRVYRPPEGTVELPYIQLFDASRLVDGASYQRLVVDTPRDGSLFVIRRIMGAGNVCSRIQVRFGESTIAAVDAGRGWVMDPCFIVFPEREVVGPDFLSLDLIGVNRARRTEGAYSVSWAQIAFQGVRRLKGVDSKPPWYYSDRLDLSVGRPFAFVENIVVGWDGATSPQPRSFTIPVRQWDFLWLSTTLAGSAGSDAVPGDPELAFLFYDASGNKLMSDPVPDIYLRSNAVDEDRAYFACFPVPPVIYPVDSVIRYDVRSLLLPSQVTSPVTYQLALHGIRLFRR